MNAAPSVRSRSTGATYWGITWGVGVGLLEYLIVAPIDEWGSMRQLLFWLLYWVMPFWCLVGCMFVWLADHHEPIAPRGRLLAAVLALCAFSAALDPLLSFALLRLIKEVFPQFGRYAAALPIEPMWINLTSFSFFQIFLYQLWTTIFYGGLLVATRIFTVRVERTRHLLHQSAMARSRTEALLDNTRLQTLQSQIDPNLLLDSMQELDQRYRSSPERAEALLEALVEFLRYAMHGLRVPVSTLDAEVQLARAFSHLQRERGVGGEWRFIEEPATPPANSIKFPSLLMLRLLALGDDGARPMLRVKAVGGQTILSLHGLSRGVSAELRQQIRARLYALYGESFHFENNLADSHQLKITLRLPAIPSGESHA